MRVKVFVRTLSMLCRDVFKTMCVCVFAREVRREREREREGVRETMDSYSVKKIPHTQSPSQTEAVGPTDGAIFFLSFQTFFLPFFCFFSPEFCKCLRSTDLLSVY
jgi:hypothetical protein